MKPEELRIGNWIAHKVDGLYDQVRVLSEKHVNGYGDGDALKPIPLTEEWLRKFGFETDEVDNTIVLPNGDASELNLERQLPGTENVYSIAFTRGVTKGVPGKDYDFVGNDI